MFGFATERQAIIYPACKWFPVSATAKADALIFIAAEQASRSSLVSDRRELPRLLRYPVGMLRLERLCCMTIRCGGVLRGQNDRRNPSDRGAHTEGRAAL